MLLVGALSGVIEADVAAQPGATTGVIVAYFVLMRIGVKVGHGLIDGPRSSTFQQVCFLVYALLLAGAAPAAMTLINRAWG